MNEDKKATPQTTMQDAVQQMLPDTLKKQFVLQKNSGTLGQEPTTPPASELPKFPSLDPNLVQKSIRTFEGDLAEALKKKQGSVASISIAESKRKEAESRKVETSQVARSKENDRSQNIGVGQSQPKKATAPTKSTAIPGASISLPPTIDKGSDSVNAEITEALKIVRPASEVLAQTQKTPEITQQNVGGVSDHDSLPIANVPTNITFAEPHTNLLKPIALTIAGLILIGSGIFVGYYYFLQFNTRSTTPISQEPITIPSLLPFDSQLHIPLSRERGDQIVSKMYSEVHRQTITPKSTLEIIFSDALSNISNPLSGSEFLERMETDIPNVIARSITDRWMMGIYGDTDEKKTTFLVLTTDFFQNAFAGMLIWEENGLADDLALLLNYKDRGIKQDLSASSTIQTYFGLQGTYSDRILRNRDVREFRNQYGELLFLYSFINKETILITTTESAFLALIDKIEKDSYVR